MTIARTESAVTELAHLQAATPDTEVVLSFTDPQNIAIAAWAAERFAPSMLIGRVIDRYNQDPIKNDNDDPKDIYESGSIKWQHELDEAEAVGVEVAQDLKTAAKRLKRGYPIGSVVMHGVVDATVIIGSLERAVELHPENLDSGEQYKQAAAKYILEHMQVVDSDIGRAVSYLL